MPRFVALLRGVNVGGGNRVPMAELRSLAGGLGWRGVRSYFASGNLVFNADHTAAALADSLRRAMAAEVGVDVPVRVLDRDEFVAAVHGCPFARDAGKAVHGFFCWSEPVIDTALYEALRLPDEQVQVRGHMAWLLAPDGIGRSKLAEKIGKVLGGVEMTGRNLNTILALAKMLDADDPA